jgi:competence protein ComEA
MVSVIGAVKQPGAYTLLSTARVSDLLRAADGLLPGADVSSINLAARLIDGSTLAIPSKTTRRFQNGVLTARGGQPVPSHNPPQYTLSRGVSMQASPSPIPVSTATSDAGSGLLDLNTASEKELDTLPGIGPKLASEIVRYRTTSPFQSVDDILNVPGIGEKKAEMIRPLVTVSPTRQ